MFLNLWRRWELAELNQEEAAELLGVSERTFRRWTRRYEEENESGLIDRRLGKASGKRVPSDRAEEVERLYRERYQGFTVKPFHEHLVRDHWVYGDTDYPKSVRSKRNADCPATRGKQPLPMARFALAHVRGLCSNRHRGRGQWIFDRTGDTLPSAVRRRHARRGAGHAARVEAPSE